MGLCLGSGSLCGGCWIGIWKIPFTLCMRRVILDFGFMIEWWPPERIVPGIGLIAAMEFLVEFQDVSRFRGAEQIAAYVGLTPSQYSSAEKIRMGRITGIGKNGLRAILVEGSWKLITKDGVMREKYTRIKARSGGKRAIVASARTLLLKLRRILLDGCPYAMGVIG